MPPTRRRSEVLLATSLIALSLGALSIGGCRSSLNFFRQYECTVEISPTADPSARLRVSNRDLRFRDEQDDLLADYFSCHDGETIYTKDVCEECAFNFDSTENPGDGSPMEDHWDRLVARQVESLGQTADPNDPDDAGYEFARYDGWCVHTETLDCQQFGVAHNNPIPCATEEIAPQGLSQCPDTPPAGELIIGCNPGEEEGCSTATLETPLGETASLEVRLSNGGGIGDPEIAIRDIAIEPLGNSPLEEFILRDVPGEPSCNPSFPVGGDVHLLSLPEIYAEGSTCVIGLDFTPADPLTRTVQLAFTAAGARRSIEIEATGQPGLLAATPAAVCLEATRIDCTEPAVVRITNGGPGSATVFGVTLTEADPTIPNFEFVPIAGPDLGPGFVIEPGFGALEIELRSCRSPEPGDIQDVVGTLVVAHDNVAAGPLEVPLAVQDICP